MRTVFIPIFQGVAGRTVLRTELYKHLLSRDDLRLILLLSFAERRDYYVKEFSHPRLIYEVVPAIQGNNWERRFGDLKFHLLNSATTRLRKRMIWEQTGNYVIYILSLLLDVVLANRLGRGLARWLDFHLTKTNTFDSLFAKYEPEMVFSVHPTDDKENALIREAKKRGIKTAVFINSWDKLTARSFLRTTPDLFLVPNQIIQSEAIRYHQISKAIIKVVGLPQYDMYINWSPGSRADFCQHIKAKENKKIIVYCPMGKTYSDSDRDMVGFLSDAIAAGQIIGQPHLLVRNPPNDRVEFAEKFSWPELTIDSPGKMFSLERGVDWDMDAQDLRHLLDTLFYGSLFICYASSMSIDAAVFNKPVINIGFEIKSKDKLIKSPTHFYHMTHYRNLLKTGGVDYPHDKQSLLKSINDYLARPEKDESARKTIVQEQCFLLDGHSAQRIAEALLNQLYV